MGTEPKLQASVADGLRWDAEGKHSEATRGKEREAAATSQITPPCPQTNERTNYIHTYMHTYMHTYIHAYVHAYTHTYMHRHVNKYIVGPLVELGMDIATKVFLA